MTRAPMIRHAPWGELPVANWAGSSGERASLRSSRAHRLLPRILGTGQSEDGLSERVGMASRVSGGAREPQGPEWMSVGHMFPDKDESARAAVSAALAARADSVAEFSRTQKVVTSL